MKKITKKNIINSWTKYNGEFSHYKTSYKMNEQFNIFESEVLYSLIRYLKFSHIIEISPYQGFTTKVMLNAIKKIKLIVKFIVMIWLMIVNF